MNGFDEIAASYDQLWTETDVGEIQRRAVWKLIDPLFAPGDSVLDLGCGTGADAIHLERLAVQVQGIDASSEMVAIADARGVRARQHRLENLDQLAGSFDGAISNFGAVNCVASIEKLALDLGRLIRSGGYLALCFIGRICLWEVGHYLARGQFGKAVRRLGGRARSSYNLDVYYPSRRAIVNAFGRQFTLIASSGVGLTVPPSYVRHLSRRTLERLGSIDAALASMPFFRALSDHQLYIWRRV